MAGSTIHICLCEGSVDVYKHEEWSKQAYEKKLKVWKLVLLILSRILEMTASFILFPLCDSDKMWWKKVPPPFSCYPPSVFASKTPQQNYWVQAAVTQSKL